MEKSNRILTEERTTIFPVTFTFNKSHSISITIILNIPALEPDRITAKTISNTAKKVLPITHFDWDNFGRYKIIGNPAQSEAAYPAGLSNPPVMPR
ncbi:MAG: hypothetical protein LUH22_15215 [Bacteroides sp.]|nr:hypothetical protein [Bacteroides sp.]